MISLAQSNIDEALRAPVRRPFQRKRRRCLAVQSAADHAHLWRRLLALLTVILLIGPWEKPKRRQKEATYKNHHWVADLHSTHRANKDKKVKMSVI